MRLFSHTFKADGLKLYGEICLPDNGFNYPAVCFCHGIPAARYDPSDRGYRLLARRFCDFGFAALVFNFRGAGKSEGNIDMMGWTRDLMVALDVLADVKEVNQSRISIFGSSAGAAIAVYVAARDKRAE
jgi:dipeptidyl aminopeptidase/acylaminoacyl peptidase